MRGERRDGKPQKKTKEGEGSPPNITQKEKKKEGNARRKSTQNHQHLLISDC